MSPFLCRVFKHLKVFLFVVEDDMIEFLSTLMNALTFKIAKGLHLVWEIRFLKMLLGRLQLLVDYSEHR